jgi:peptide deformylase
MSKIVDRDHPALHTRAAEVAASEIGTPELNKLLTEMSQALAGEADGIAIAAPQLGANKRIFLVSPRIHGDKQTADDRDLVFINPVITKLSKKKEMMEEGCLSVRWLYGEVSRATKATVEALDEHGQKFTRHGSGLMAQIFQHELDHLEGILFTEKAENLRDVPPETDNDEADDD